jgi:dihydrofolate synthase/folylpolyglutamate synthase
MAFDYFAKKGIDIAIVEAGLGGRLDSTNIITPEVSIITNIGWDHMNLLGNSLQQIATEKAGIIKPGIPAVIGESSPETKEIFECAAKQAKSTITFADERQYVSDWKHKQHQLIVEVADTENDERHLFHLDLQGLYQSKNLLTVIESIKILKNQWNLHPNDIHKGLAKVKKLTELHGRWDIIHHHPEIVLDVGHNAEGIHQIISQIELMDHKDLHIVIGLVKDKEIEKILSLLPNYAMFYFTKAQIPRAFPEDQLADLGKKLGLNGNHYPDVNTAIRTAISKSSEDDLIVVCGSVYLVGEVDESAVRFQSAVRSQ